jgi:hypothetical protein
MSLRNLVVVIILGIVLFCAIAGEGYFYFYSQKQNSAANSVILSIQNALNSKSVPNALAKARSNLRAQTEKLKQMQADFPSSPALDVAIKADISAAATAEAKADLLAADPKLNISAQANIIELGQKATEALSYLEYLATTPASTVALNDAAENAVELVAAYSNELHAYIAGLTPSNSGLTAGEIPDYKAQVDGIVAEVNSTEDSLNKIDSIPASSVPDITSNNGQISIIDDQGNTNATTTTSQAPNSNIQVPNNNQIPSNNNQNNDQGSMINDQVNTNQGGNSGSGGVTLGDIVVEQNIVTQTTDEVNQLGDQTTGEAASSSDSSDNSSSSVNGNSDNNSYTSGDNNNPGPIQPQSGPVKLIEGENTF